MKNTNYVPLTATPFQQNKKYTERPPQNLELANYIRCFWGSEQPYLQKEQSVDASIVVPDTCVDIIYNIDYTDNTITGGFCGINDASFWDHDRKESGHLVSIFAIRFFAWNAYVFSEDSLKDTINTYADVRMRFRWLDDLLRQQLFDKRTLEERRKAAEEILLGRLSVIRQNSMIDNAVEQIILRKGTQSVTELAKECFISSRQLERLFHEYIGITPKKLCSLVRYQYLWHEILTNPRFHVLDAVYKYAYTDQSHLMREFKRYHAMDIRMARLYAYQHCGSHVGNIQDFSNQP